MAELLMPARPLDTKALAAAAQRHHSDWLYKQSTASTNADVLQHYRQHLRESIAVSETQTAGRGRRGREWHSPFAQNIYCSIGMIKTLPPSCQGLLSIVTGIALCRALRSSVSAELQLKWPNDLLHDGNKLGGILIESRPHNEAQIFFAIGFGINVFMSDEDLAAIARPATSLDRIGEAAIDRSLLLESAIDAVVDAVRAFDSARVQALVDEFQHYDAFHGKRVELLCGEQRIAGINRGISPSGELRLETERGIEIHSAAEISLRVVAL